MEEKYYECSDCRYFRVDKETGEGFCKKTYVTVYSDSSACDDFDLDNIDY